MTGQERLMAALFGNPQREHADVKFFVLGSMDLTADVLCGEAADMLEQMDASEGDEGFAEGFAQREASEFVASV
jgi:tRNA U34 5-methylaminomethyl-2-thiouridine-forming methyltransferase MnmC